MHLDNFSLRQIKIKQANLLFGISLKLYTTLY